MSAIKHVKFVLRATRRADLVESGGLTLQAAFVDAAVRAGLNVLVAKGRQAGMRQGF